MVPSQTEDIIKTPADKTGVFLLRFVNAARKQLKGINHGYFGHSVACNQMVPRCNCGVNDMLYALEDYEKSLVIQDGEFTLAAR